MDRISESLLNEFSTEHGITALPEKDRFEHFASYITIKRHHSETFDTEDVVMGAGGDTGIDGLAVIVNGSLVTDVESFEQQMGFTGNLNLDVLFVFVQAERSASFDGAKIGTFGFGVMDFFKQSDHSLIRNERISAAADIMAAIYRRSSKFRSNPACWVYYVTTGKWVNDHDLEGRKAAVVSDLKGTGLFSRVEFQPVDAAELQKLYRQTKNAVSKEFLFANRTVVPEVPGVSEAYLGFLPAAEFLKLLQDDNEELIGGLFYDNVRDWQNYNDVNSEIQTTLDSDARDRFVLMNNGVTIIANKIQTTGNKFYIEDYQIVNGCQTSHVLFNNRDKLNERVMVPVRLIGSKDEGVTNAIIRATNRQTEVKEEQFFALQEFPKALEIFFQSFPDPHKLFYERRSRQYDRLSIEKTRIVLPANLIKAVAAMFLSEPHRTTRNYSAIYSKVGKEIFVRGQKMELYYTSALCLYKLEYQFRNRRLEAKYKPARFHILLAARLLANPDPLPSVSKWNSNEMEKYCQKIMTVLWDGAKSDEVMTRAALIIDEVADSNFHRDNIRTEPFTRKVIERSLEAAKSVQLRTKLDDNPGAPSHSAY
jgi:hypothetical protein